MSCSVTRHGLVREVFFEGFRLLGDRFGKLRDSGDPRADLVRMVGALRVFVRENPVLAQVMFSRPFADFDPGPGDLAAGAEDQGVHGQPGPALY